MTPSVRFRYGKSLDKPGDETELERLQRKAEEDERRANRRNRERVANRRKVRQG